MIGAVALRALLAAAVVGAGTAAAHAGAWTQAKGHGQVIVSGTYTDSPKGFDDDGNAVDSPDYRKFELNTLIEYGITDAVTAILQPQIQSVDIGQPTDAARFGLGYSELGGRVRLSICALSMDVRIASTPSAFRFSTYGLITLSKLGLSFRNSIRRVSPLALRRMPSLPTIQPASSSRADALRRLARSNCRDPDLGAITGSSVRIDAGSSPSSTSGFRTATSSGEGAPVAASHEFSQTEFMRAYSP